MALQSVNGRQTPFDLGFEHDAEAEEEPSTLEFCSRIHEYQLGFIVGRSFSEAVKHANHAAAAATAGALGHRYGVKLDDLLQAMRLTADDELTIRQSYCGAGSNT